MRPSWVEVDLDAIRHNVRTISDVVGPARFCAVVKADAYGHGDVPVAEAALEAGASWLAVALVSEGIGLREAGIEAPILLLSEPSLEDAGQVVQWNLTPTAYRPSFVDALVEAAPPEFPVHVKVDTGMHRAGSPPEEALGLAAGIAGGPLRLQGAWTHFAVAEEDPEFTAGQVTAFRTFLADLAAAGVRPEMVHAANTAGALGDVDAGFDMVRVGIGIYGLRPAPGFAAAVELRPAMSLVSQVVHARRYPAGSRMSYGLTRPLPADATVVTVPVGYADGISRRLSSVGRALVGGVRHPFAGNITMDQTLVDVGDADVSVGDEVVFLGSQGDDEITADEWAAWMGTINWEVVCGFGPRLPRRYVG